MGNGHGEKWSGLQLMSDNLGWSGSVGFTKLFHTAYIERIMGRHMIYGIVQKFRSVHK